VGQRLEVGLDRVLRFGREFDQRVADTARLTKRKAHVEPRGERGAFVCVIAAGAVLVGHRIAGSQERVAATVGSDHETRLWERGGSRPARVARAVEKD
jgi:diphthamide synthase (EF-2-diphthine--ammonia ligase)